MFLGLQSISVIYFELVMSISSPQYKLNSSLSNCTEKNFTGLNAVQPWLEDEY